MRMEALTEALRECRVACWICVCANSLSHIARPTAPLSQCPVVLQVSALPAALPHTTHKRLCNPRPTPSTHLICFSYSFHRCTLPAPLSYAAVLFLLAWGDICAQRLSSKRSFFVCVFRNAAFHEFISSNEGKQQIDSHDLFTRAWHPLSPTLGGKINISSIQLFFFYSETDMLFGAMTESAGCESDWRCLYCKPKLPRKPLADCDFAN